MFCGLEMTAESYDDDAALRAYVRVCAQALPTIDDAT